MDSIIEPMLHNFHFFGIEIQNWIVVFAIIFILWGFFLYLARRFK